MVWNRLHKNQARELAIDYAEKIAKIALFLPSDECLCILKALAEGKVNRNTFIIAIEKDKVKAAKIRRFLAARFKRFHLHEGDVCSLDLGTILGKDEALDFAYCDFCGDMTERLYKWLQELRFHCWKGAKVCFTFTARNRNNHFTADIRRRENELWVEGKVYRYVKDWQPICYANGVAKHNAAMPTLIALATACRFKIDLGREYRDGQTPMLVFLTTV